MKMQSRLRCLLLVQSLISATAAGQGEFPVKEENGVRAEMRDGVSLVADIFRPEQDGTFPVLLQRTPYDRGTSAAQARELASYGYIVVVGP